MGTRRRIGEPIDWADAWAAACALWLDLPLVTHDRGLEGIPDLRVLTVHHGWRVGEETMAEVVASGTVDWGVPPGSAQRGYLTVADPADGAALRASPRAPHGDAAGLASLTRLTSHDVSLRISRVES